MQTLGSCSWVKLLASLTSSCRRHVWWVLKVHPNTSWGVFPPPPCQTSCSCLIACVPVLHWNVIHSRQRLCFVHCSETKKNFFGYLFICLKCKVTFPPIGSFPRWLPVGRAGQIGTRSQELLDFSQVGTGAQPPEPSPLPLMMYVGRQLELGATARGCAQVLEWGVLTTRSNTYP